MESPYPVSKLELGPREKVFNFSVTSESPEIILLGAARPARPARVMQAVQWNTGVGGCGGIGEIAVSGSSADGFAVMTASLTALLTTLLAGKCSKCCSQ